MTGTTRICKATTKTGARCRVHVLNGSGYCYFHDPAMADKRKESTAKGGRARHGRTVGTTTAGERVQIESLADVVKLLANEIDEVLTLEKSISRARAIGYLAGVLVTVYQHSELEARVVALERELGK